MLTALSMVRGSAWAQSSQAHSSQDLAEVSVGTIQEMQSKSEARLDALEKLNAQRSQKQTPDGRAPANGGSGTETKSERASETQRRIPPLVRDGEESYAGVPDVQLAIPDQFDDLQKRLSRASSADARLALLESYVAEHYEHHDARLFLARELMINDLPSRALIALAPLTEAVHKRTHPDWQPWFWLGTAYLSLEQSAQGRAALEVALSKAQDVGEIWLHLAIAEQLEDNHSGALQYLQVARQLLPQSAQVHLNVAYSHERLGDLTAARSSYQQFLVADNTDVTPGTRPAIVRHLATLAQVH